MSLVGVAEIRRDLGYALIRIFLGVALFVRGWILVSDPSAITMMAGVQQVEYAVAMDNFFVRVTLTNLSQLFLAQDLFLLFFAQSLYPSETG